MPNPLRLLLRLTLCCSIVLGLAHHYQRAIMEPLLPAIQRTIATVQGDFTILSLDIADAGPNESLRLRANLAQPVTISDRVFYPIGWNTNHTGGYQITMTLGGAMTYSLLMLIVALAWPANHWSTAAKRTMIALPFMMALLLLNVAITFPAELWTPIHNAWVPDITWPLLIWSKIMMGGGGLLLALLCGAAVISLSQHRDRISASIHALSDSPLT